MSNKVILYGVCGENLGHLGRSLPLIRRLSETYDVRVVTFGHSYDMILKSGLPKEKVYGVSGLKYDNKHDGAIDQFNSILNFIECVSGWPEELNRLESLVSGSDVVLCISDFEPLVPRLAKRLRVPCISIDNQHKFVMVTNWLPPKLFLYALMVGIFTKWWIPGTMRSLISTFHGGKSRGKFQFIDPIIRKEISEQTVSNDGSILVYVKPYLQGRILAALEPLTDKYKFVVYGAQGLSDRDNMVFKSPDVMAFADDLASCSSVICTGGNQTISEARFLGKPVLAIPIPGQDEQTINGLYVRRCGLGELCQLEDLTPAVVRAFLLGHYEFSPGSNGIEQAISIINEIIVN